MSLLVFFYLYNDYINAVVCLKQFYFNKNDIPYDSLPFFLYWAVTSMNNLYLNAFCFMGLVLNSHERCKLPNEAGALGDN